MSLCQYFQNPTYIKLLHDVPTGSYAKSIIAYSTDFLKLYALYHYQTNLYPIVKRVKKKNYLSEGKKKKIFDFVVSGSGQPRFTVNL